MRKSRWRSVYRHASEGPFDGLGYSRCERNLRFRWYGTHAQCLGCEEKCKQYQAKGLTRLVCRKSPEWERENEKIKSA